MNYLTDAAAIEIQPASRPQRARRSTATELVALGTDRGFSGGWNDPLAGHRNRLVAKDSGPLGALCIDAGDGRLQLSEPGD